MIQNKQTNKHSKYSYRFKGWQNRDYFVNLKFVMNCRSQEDDISSWSTRWHKQTYWFTVVVLRLSPCSECSLYSSGNFPGVWSLKADVSGLNVGPIVLGDQEWSWNEWNSWSPRTMGLTWVPKRRLLNFRRRGNSQKNTKYILIHCLNKKRSWI